MPNPARTAVALLAAVCIALPLAVAAQDAEQPAAAAVEPVAEAPSESFAAEASEPRPADPGVLFLEVLDAGGSPVAGLEESAFQITEDGRVRAIEELAPLARESGDWRIAIYIDLLLSEPLELAAAVYHLAAAAEGLVALGEVEIVLADESVRRSLPPTRSAVAVDEALSWIRLRESAEGAQLEVRRAFLDEFVPGRGERSTPPSGGELTAGLRLALAGEAELLSTQRELLSSWLADRSSDALGSPLETRPSLVILVSSGFDRRPREFYAAALAEAGLDELLEDGLDSIVTPRPEPPLARLAEALSTYGWMVAPFAAGDDIDPLLVETDEERRRREEDAMIETVTDSGIERDKVVVGIDPLKLFRRKKADEEVDGVKARLIDAHSPLVEVAAATGGELLRSSDELGRYLARQASRYRLRFDSGGDAPAAEPREIRVEVRGADRSVRARRYVSEATPEALARVRAERYFASEVGDGELAVEATIERGGGLAAAGLAVRLGADSLAPDGGAPLRITVAADREDGSLEVSHFIAGGAAGLPLSPQADGSWTVQLPYAAHPEAAVATVVEELATGRWGGDFAEEPFAASADADADRLVLPAPRQVVLMAPAEGMVMGRTRFEAVVSEAATARVDFYVDGRKVASSGEPPHSFVADLGNLPESRVIEAVAYGADGSALDRDRLTVNEGSGSFRVRIIDPRSGPQRAGTAQLVGSVEFEVDIKTPRGNSLERLDFYWREQRIGSRYAQPWVQRFEVPADDPRGFLRVVGTLDDGSSQEDVLLINSPGSSERLNVDLVELYVVVTDRRGRPIRDLDRGKFRVVEETERQELANFGDAGDLPLTVGLAIDSSASMFVKLPEVQSAAADYVRGLSRRRDRAFVVGFGNQPQLARDTTADLPQVVNGLYRLEPDGQTAIWKAVVYSLVQLQGVPGKKALIVYSDGADEDPDFSYKTCLRFAQRVGVPIYFIVSNDEIYRTGGKSSNVRSFLGRLQNLAREVGGRVFLTRVGEDLEEIYEEIDQELRSQYLLGYYPTDRSGQKWRKVKVEVDVPGARARTISGYFR